ncbi:hypothetical protein N7532_004318 [Penicillium argentinense]|uniref:Uncharacterized protein n=1 Tax=Penicillium argentinense TaxID=1131581 RepID=A0A9W9FP91_9EURO|nr:uncharacterized protein N7532_004318 [Penicillium argentinense]KAJ5103789.1 hypothetical protein N7532_004318 [Penicillium argentinense]
MSAKRKSASPDPSPKRPRLDKEGDAFLTTPQEKPRSLPHPRFGQMSALPYQSDDPNDLDDSMAPSADAMKYLLDVQSRANAIPEVCLAPKFSTSASKSNSDNSVGPNEFARQKDPCPAGFLEAEAFIGRHRNSVASSNGIYPQEQVEYYENIRSQFTLLRARLQLTPPADAIACLDESHPISLPKNNHQARKDWRNILLNVDPQMAQLACMDSANVLRVLEVVGRGLSENVRAGEATVIRRMSVWIWGLLSKCHSLEEMSTEEVGEIRAFAKRAVKILSKIREAEKREKAEKQEEEAGSVDGSETGENDEQGNVASLISNVDHTTEQDAPDVEMSMPGDADQPDDLAAEKERLQTRMQDNMLTEEIEVEDSVKQQIRVLLDMMITIAGEFFGQRDLLAAREVWAKAHTA